LASLYIEILYKSTDPNNPVKQYNLNKTYIFCVNCTWPKVYHVQDFISFWNYHYVTSLHVFLWYRHFFFFFFFFFFQWSSSLSDPEYYRTCDMYNIRRQGGMWLKALSNVLLKSRSIPSTCSFLFRLSARTWTVIMSCDSHDREFRKPCWASIKIPCMSRCFITVLCMMCSMILLHIGVSDTGL
jgi:hypothetical protein